MPERGGPTTQSGIWYQNTVAALYLGRMLDGSDRPIGDQVVSVRVEALQDVDDIVVVAADGHTVYVQAKERVGVGDAAWRKLWRDFSTQYQRGTFVRGTDRLRFQVGEHHPDFVSLREMTSRAHTSATTTEWLARLTQDQQSLRRSVAAAAFAPPDTSDTTAAIGVDDEVLRDLLGHVDVEMWPASSIERDFVPLWLPAASVPAHTLFRLLRDRVGGEARVRGTFTAAELWHTLQHDDGVLLHVPPSFEVLRLAVASCGALLRQHKATLGATGTHVPRAVVTDIVAWARAPQPDKSVGLLLDHAGRGKTVVMRDTMLALEAAHVPVLAIKADQQLAAIGDLNDLQRRLGFTESTERVVARLAAVGRVVVLIDQIDALSLALARDQDAMNVVLDLVGRLRGIPAVTILLSCRTFDRRTDPRLKRIEVGQEFTVPLLTEEEVTSVLHTLRVAPETLAPATRELLRTPLHLDLYASLARASRSETGRLHGIASLQELYGLLWDDVVRRPDPDGPAVANRVAVLRALTDRMHRDRRTTAPYTTLDALGPATAQAANWLASEAVLVPSAGAWSFLHQTFFDYCYARFFVEDGERLRVVVLASDQGLFIRPQIVHVLAHLRGTGHPEYLQTLDSLLDGADLRFHLHDLVVRWFGGLPNPDERERALLQRRLLNSELRPTTLTAIGGNPAWYGRLAAGMLDGLLRTEPTTVNEQVVPYLASVVNDRTVQAAIAALAQTWFHREEPWPTRAHWLTQRIQAWHTPEAIALYEAMLERVPLPNIRHAFQLDDIAAADSTAGLRILRRLFDRVLDARNAAADSRRWTVRGVEVGLDVLDDHSIGKALGVVSAAAPAAFLDAMLPWLERAVTVGTPTEDDFDEDADDRYHRPDPLRRLSTSRSGLRTSVLDAFATALRLLATADPRAFQEHTGRIAALPYATPQELLAHVYRDTMPTAARDALRFVSTDARRLRLGEDEALLTRQLIKALAAHVGAADLEPLERLIMTTTGKIRRWGRDVGALNWRGADQLHLLRALPPTTLSPAARARLGELERKFPRLNTPDEPMDERGGWVGPPISIDVLRRMPDRGWLGAMSTYTCEVGRRGRRGRREFLRGGRRELASQLQSLTKEDPARFAALAALAPNDLEDAYVEAFVAGLAESSCSPEWVFDLVRRYASPDRPEIRRRITWALEQTLRRSDGLPQDITEMLDGWIRGTPGEDETRYDTGEQDLWSAAINTDRPSAVLVLLTALRKDDGVGGVDRQWDLLEFIARDPSPVLRVAGLHELPFMLAHDATRAIALFEEIIRDDLRLCRAEPFHEFLYYASLEHFSTLAPYLRLVMEAPDPRARRRGAELAVLAHLALHTTQHAQNTALADALVEDVISGPVEWRRGAAHIYAYNLPDYCGNQCETGLRRLLDDPDTEVRQHVASLPQRLRTEHAITRVELLSAFAASPSVRSGLYGFAEYLWEHGAVNPPWVLEAVEAVLGNRHHDDAGVGLAAGDYLVRAVLRVYTDPTTGEPLRRRAMDVFDRLIERFSSAALGALSEWDRG